MKNENLQSCINEKDFMTYMSLLVKNQIIKIEVTWETIWNSSINFSAWESGLYLRHRQSVMYKKYGREWMGYLWYLLVSFVSISVRYPILQIKTPKLKEEQHLSHYPVGGDSLLSLSLSTNTGLQEGRLSIQGSCPCQDLENNLFMGFSCYVLVLQYLELALDIVVVLFPTYQ